MGLLKKIKSLVITLSRIDPETDEKEYIDLVRLDDICNYDIWSYEQLDRLLKWSFVVTIVKKDGSEEKARVIHFCTIEKMLRLCKENVFTLVDK